MSWARLDDRANEHRKQLAAGAEACWLWACGLMYANRQEARDGFIPEQMVAMLYPVKNASKLAAKLVDVRLWNRVEGGYQIHKYHRLNLTKEQYDAKLSSGRDRAAKSYAIRPKNHNSSREEPAKKHDSSGSNPNQSKPIQTKQQQNSDARERAEPAAAAAVQSLPVRKAPANRDDALKLPLRERAAAALEQPEAWSWAAPHTWPEVVNIATALARAAGEAKPRLGDQRRDAGVRTVLGLYADGWGAGELTSLAHAIGLSKWWRTGGRKGLSSLTPEVLRRAQNEQAADGDDDDLDPDTAREIAEIHELTAAIGTGGA